MLHSRDLLFVHSICECPSTNPKPPIHPHLPSSFWVNTRLFSMSVRLFLLLRHVHVCHIVESIHITWHLSFSFDLLHFFFLMTVFNCGWLSSNSSHNIFFLQQIQNTLKQDLVYLSSIFNLLIVRKHLRVSWKLNKNPWIFLSLLLLLWIWLEAQTCSQR